jgi:hypothetical protein
MVHTEGGRAGPPEGAPRGHDGMAQAGAHGGPGGGSGWSRYMGTEGVGHRGGRYRGAQLHTGRRTGGGEGAPPRRAGRRGRRAAARGRAARRHAAPKGGGARGGARRSSDPGAAAGGAPPGAPRAAAFGGARQGKAMEPAGGTRLPPETNAVLTPGPGRARRRRGARGGWLARQLSAHWPPRLGAFQHILGALGPGQLPRGGGRRHRGRRRRRPRRRRLPRVSRRPRHHGTSSRTQRSR